MEVLPKHFVKYGLSLHPEKTRLVRFCPPRAGADPEPGSFELLGFTHFWALSRKGRWVIKRKTAKGRFRRALKRVAVWCRRHRHLPVKEQHQMLTWKLRGHYAYYGITGNARALEVFLFRVRLAWHKWLARRSNRGMPWARFVQLEERYPLPRPVAIHSVLRRAAKP